MPLVGSIDAAGHEQLRGWVRDPAFPDAPVCLLVTANDEFVQRVVANCHRPDVQKAGFGNGRFGFDTVFTPPLLPSRSWLIRIFSEADGEEVPGSPVHLPASGAFGEQAQTAFAAAIGSVATREELDQRIDFLAGQWERLLQTRVGLQAKHPACPPVPNRGGGVAGGPARPQRALVIDAHGIPDPGRDGGSGALVSHMRSLQRLGYDVTFAAPEMTDSPASPALRRAGIRVCHAPWFGSVEEVLRREINGYDLVYLHRVSTAVDYTNLVRRYLPNSHVVYSVADLHHVRLIRQAVVEGREDLVAAARRVKEDELWAARAADAVITHSSTEAALLREAAPGVPVHVMAWSLPHVSAPARFADRQGMAFVGNFRHAPNASAALHLRDRIMPAVHAQDPHIECRLAGADLPAFLAPPQPGLTVVGEVPDMRALLGSVRLTVAPLRFGAGVKAKVMESLAAGIPCVCSPVAAEGLDLPAELQALVTSDTASTAAAVLRLHHDEAYNAVMSAHGLRFARSAFSEQRLDDAMRDATRRTAGRQDARSTQRLALATGQSGAAGFSVGSDPGQAARTP